MKLQCSVALLLGDGLQSKPAKSTLALGREPENTSREAKFFLMHFDASASRKCGFKYALRRDNVERVFCKFRAEGKATIRFARPPHSLLVSLADPLRLGLFLAALGRCLDGTADPKALRLCTPSSVPPSSADAGPTSLAVVHNPAELPIKSFPRTLRKLRLEGLGMRTLRSDVVSLRQLTTLDLKTNSLTKLPAAIGDMPNLVELRLAENRFGEARPNDWKWLEGKRISTRLKLLDLSANAMQYLPTAICKLSGLVTLTAKRNQITRLPQSIGKLKSLRYLSLSDNELASLPESVLRLRLQEVDFAANPLQLKTPPPNGPTFLKASGLLDAAAAVVLRNGIRYASDLIPYTLVDYLDNALYCACGSPTFNAANRVERVHSLKAFCDTVVSAGVHDATFESYLCSYACYKTYFARKRSRRN